MSCTTSSVPCSLATWCLVLAPSCLGWTFLFLTILLFQWVKETVHLWSSWLLYGVLRLVFTSIWKWRREGRWVWKRTCDKLVVCKIWLASLNPLSSYNGCVDVFGWFCMYHSLQYFIITSHTWWCNIMCMYCSYIHTLYIHINNTGQLTVWQCDSMTMTVWLCDSMTVWQCDSITVRQYMTVWQYDCDSMTVWQCDSTTV